MKYVVRWVRVNNEKIIKKFGMEEIIRAESRISELYNASCFFKGKVVQFPATCKPRHIIRDWL